MIAQQMTAKQATKQHSANEFRANANGQRAYRWANEKLAELATATDPIIIDFLKRSYLHLLKGGHKNGTAGSLLEAVQ